MRIRWCRVSMAAATVGCAVLLWRGCGEPDQRPGLSCGESLAPDASGRIRIDSLEEADLLTWVCTIAGANGLHLGAEQDPSIFEGRTLTIRSNVDVHPEAALMALSSAMEADGLTLQVLDDEIEITKPGLVTRMVTVRNMDVSDGARILESMMGEGTTIATHAPSRTLIFTGTLEEERAFYKLAMLPVCTE